VPVVRFSDIAILDASSKIHGVVCRVDTILDTTKASNVGLPPEPEGRVRRDGRPGARRRVMTSASEVYGIQQDPVSDAGIELPGSKESKTVITPGRHI